jgi:hypothetical protein
MVRETFDGFREDVVIFTIVVPELKLRNVQREILADVVRRRTENAAEHRSLLP